MKKYLTLIILIACSTTVWAQQDVQFTQFTRNKLFYNPGVAGASDGICLNAAHRSQWVGVEYAPSTQKFTANIPMLSGGLSVNVTQDQIGNFNDVIAGVGYAHQMNIGSGTLGIGLRVNFRNKSMLTNGWVPPQTMNDASLIALQSNSMATDLNFGLYYKASDFYAGFSSSRLLETKDILENNAGAPASINGRRHYFLMGGYDYDLENGFVLQPALLLKTDLTATQLDINLAAEYNNEIWGGVSYRVNDAIAIMAGYNITPELQVAYSYDITTSTLNVSSNGSHEVSLRYCFTIDIPEPPGGSYDNPIWLGREWE